MIKKKFKKSTFSFHKKFLEKSRKCSIKSLDLDIKVQLCDRINLIEQFMQVNALKSSDVASQIPARPSSFQIFNFVLWFLFLWFRPKRQADSWFLAPNSKWCGSGHSAKNYKELGSSKSDGCCRRHDHCRMTIGGLQTKFGLFNSWPFTISHCKCDRRLISTKSRILIAIYCVALEAALGQPSSTANQRLSLSLLEINWFPIWSGFNTHCISP